MKKTMILFAVLFVTPAVWAKSTCEVRVDRHQNATTLERVDYCLNDSGEDDARPKVISYSITTNTPKQTSQQESGYRTPSHFNSKRVKVSRTYVESKHFPAWENEIQSESERLEQEARELEEKAAQREERLRQQREGLPLPDDDWFDLDEEYFAEPGQPHKVKSVTITPTSTTVREEETTTRVSPDGQTVSTSSSSRVHGVVVSGPRHTEVTEEFTTTTTVTNSQDREFQVKKRLAKPGRVMGDSNPANTDPLPEGVSVEIQPAEQPTQPKVTPTAQKPADDDLANDFEYNYVPSAAEEPVVIEETVETSSEVTQTQETARPVEEPLDVDAFSEADALWSGK